MGHSQETREKISRSNSGKVFSPERCKNISRALERSITSEEVEQLQVYWNKGYLGASYIASMVGLSQRVYRRAMKLYCTTPQIRFLDRTVPPEIYEEIIQSCLRGIPYREIQVDKESRWVKNAIIRLSQLYPIKPLPKPKPKMTKEHRAKLSAAISARNKRCPLKGEKNPRWAGGVSAIHVLVRSMPEYQEWRKRVFQRDQWRCVSCGSRESLAVDHIRQFALILAEESIATVEQAKLSQTLWDIQNGRVLCDSCHRNTETYGIKGRRKVENARAKQ